MKLYGKWGVCLLGAICYGFLLWRGPFWLVTCLLGVMVCSYIARLLHELGHLLACRLLGLQWKSLRFMGLVLEPGKVSVARDEKCFTSGCSFAYSPEGPIRRYILVLCSGGFATLLLAVLTGSLALCTTGSFHSFLGTLAAVSALDALGNLLIPLSPDRKLIRQIRN